MTLSREAQDNLEVAAGRALAVFDIRSREEAVHTFLAQLKGDNEWAKHDSGVRQALQKSLGGPTGANFQKAMFDTVLRRC